LISLQEPNRSEGISLSNSQRLISGLKTMNPGSPRYCIAVCVGGTTSGLALLDGQNNIMKETSVTTQSGGELMDACKEADDRISFTLAHWDEFIAHRKCFLDEISHAICNMAEQATILRDSLIGVGISSPGAVHPLTGEIIGKTGALNLPAWGEFNLIREIESRTNLSAKAVNDAKAMALGALARITQDVVSVSSESENLLNAKGEEIDSFIEIDPGTGLGGAYIVDRKVWFGQDANNPDPDVGEIWKIKPDPIQPDIHFEELASGRAALKRVTQEILASNIEGCKNLIKESKGRIQEMLRIGSGPIRKIIETSIEETGRYIGLGVNEIMTNEKKRLNAPDIRTFVIGGGMVSKTTAQAAMVRRLIFNGIKNVSSVKPLQILFSTIGGKAGIYGSASLILGQAGSSDTDIGGLSPSKYGSGP